MAIVHRQATHYAAMGHASLRPWTSTDSWEGNSCSLSVLIKQGACVFWHWNFHFPSTQSHRTLVNDILEILYPMPCKIPPINVNYWYFCCTISLLPANEAIWWWTWGYRMIVRLWPRLWLRADREKPGVSFEDSTGADQRVSMKSVSTE